MTADDAFDKLLAKNALNIPVANPSAAPAAGEDQMADTVPSPASRKKPPKREQEETIRVLNLLDGEPDMDMPGDYQPGVDDFPQRPGGFTSPTETDLQAVDEDRDTDIIEAQLHGARIFGRDIDDADFFSDIATTSNTDTVVEMIASDAPPGPAPKATPHATPYPGAQGGHGNHVHIPPPLDAGHHQLMSATGSIQANEVGLRLARTVRRFSYLPLAGMEGFESRARDVVASLISQSPERPSLAITNPRRGDGQTEVAIRLALAAARKVDFRVLLADFDMRKPQIAVRLGVSSKYFTLVDILRGSCRLGEALTYSEEDNLYVLPARATDREGDDVLNDRQVSALLGQLHTVFDFTIIACGPMEYSDPIIVCRHAGATALAGYCGFSRVSGMRGAAEKLSDAGIKLAGIFVTGD